jgi:cysteinyl-tRNA synthetase
MVRVANSAIHRGDWQPSLDQAPLLDVMGKFDDIFAVLKDDDVPKMQRVAEWARSEGRQSDITAELQNVLRSVSLSDEQVNAKIGQMKAARAARDFAASDAIRAELTAQGILIEQTKEGVRWRRK